MPNPTPSAAQAEQQAKEVIMRGVKGLWVREHGPTDALVNVKEFTKLLADALTHVVAAEREIVAQECLYQHMRYCNDCTCEGDVYCREGNLIRGCRRVPSRAQEPRT